MQEKLIDAAKAIDAIVAEVPDMTEGRGCTFERDMREALSDKPGDFIPFSVRDVLTAMHNWSIMAAKRAGISVDG